MEDHHRRSFDAFLRENANKVHRSNERVCYMQFAADAKDPSAPLLAMRMEDVLGRLDTASRLVQGLLHQLSTYDCDRQFILGLIFDERTVMSEVLWDADAI